MTVTLQWPCTGIQKTCCKCAGFKKQGPVEFMIDFRSNIFGRSCDRCGVYVSHLFSCMTSKPTESFCSYSLTDGKLSLRRLRSNVGGQHRGLRVTSDTRAVSVPTDTIFALNLFSAHCSYTFRPRPNLNPAESLTPQIPEQSERSQNIPVVQYVWVDRNYLHINN